MQYVVDTNVIVRFLTNDDEEQSKKAFEIFKRAVNQEITLFLTPIVIIECTWVLGMKRYGYSHEEIADNLITIITSPGVKTLESDVVLKALHEYKTNKIDFADAYLAAVSTKNGVPCLTWNSKDFKKCTGVEHYRPDDVL
ncbi:MULTISPECIES: PIN domain-containing protein [Bacillus cereus group]|uniref:PIN domain-containing protein n=1 Tax=Bacillus cereus group TaxID=86661 RepID=UPI0021119E36|nr:MULTISPECIES: type II toxin-antitoxin system VapC family toxin [Bacillus cereus group]MCQ6336557.1 type II toxin-antitoxin system VapC family toxin [Bacillus cereus]MDF9490455.1 type II toxin-antitoxin system VapC family toxin [Bacillus cereus]MDF9512551.1 type II toxin-antitoxin system VapC family toxin [Bacillus paranthracis]MDG1620851.1 type II toxin-antitoxin system VapC family toxin [Bacillus mobilis]MDX5840618.1 type II toxin-antitoxin system VapC family toxin [Bacillus cereus group s